MVILKEDNAMTLQWALGRILKFHKGNDILVRVVNVKTSKGICRRPIVRLAPLRINSTNNNESDQQSTSTPHSIRSEKASFNTRSTN